MRWLILSSSDWCNDWSSALVIGAMVDPLLWWLVRWLILCSCDWCNGWSSASVIDVLVDPPTVNLVAVNVDCCCLVVIQMPSILSAFNLKLLDWIHLHSSSVQASAPQSESLVFKICSRNKPACYQHSSDSTDHDAVWLSWLLSCIEQIIKVLTPMLE